MLETPLVQVWWHDAKFFPGTYKKEAIQDHKMALFKSLGYLLWQDPTTTAIAAEINDEDEYRDVTLIPSGSIISIFNLTVGQLYDRKTT